MSKDEYDIVEPMASAVAESFRAVGYSLEAAVADIVDNSISAGAASIWLDFYWNDGLPRICITDDGRGMGVKELTAAMRAGSRNPGEVRDSKDLGRFGLGLKTASFSQCRRLTTASKSSGGRLAVRCWDLDRIAESNEWQLLKLQLESESMWADRLRRQRSGTAVLWEKVDRIAPLSAKGSFHDLFLQRIEDVKRDIEMVFHRFLSGPGAISIFVNDRPVKPWDPFLKAETASQRLPDETLSFEGAKIVIQPYVLPHRSKVSEAVYESAAGPSGWSGHQGYFVYRSRRLIVPGSWLNLRLSREEHFKLARIQLDLPNTMDSAWQLDIKKSKVRPPAELRGRLKRVAELTRKAAAQIYRHRGKVLNRQQSGEPAFVWEQKKRRGRFFYSINREYPLMAELLENSGRNRKNIEAVLRLIEETVPLPLISLNTAENPDSHTLPFEGVPEREIQDYAERLFKVFTANGASPKEACARIRTFEPFDRFVETAAVLKKILGD